MSNTKIPRDYPESFIRPQRHIDDANWACEHINELVQKYPDMWVAVLDKEVVVASKDLGEVYRVAEQKEDEVGRGPCVYKFIEDLGKSRHPTKVSNSS